MEPLEQKGGSLPRLSQALSDLGALQPRVLFWRQLQINSSAAHLNGVLQHLSSLSSPPRFPAPCQPANLLWVGERQLPGQGSLQVRLQERNLPAFAKEELHVHAVGRAVVAGHA
jgi:hypothetical protein